MIAVKIETKNDTNGNPRRGFIILSDEGSVLAFADQGYRGELATLDAARDAAGPGTDVQQSVTLAVTPGQYRAYLNDAKIGHV
jgi:hypothetical protein